MAKRRRPPKPKPEPSPSLTITIYFKVSGSEEVRLLAKHPHVPGDWSHEMVLARFGIGKHLKVVGLSGGRNFVLQNFTRGEV